MSPELESIIRHPDGSEPTGTHFAPPQRLAEASLHEQIARITEHPLLEVLLTTVGGLLAVLNAQRQVLTLNKGLLDYLGIDAPEKALGLRLGEALHCPHAAEMSAGCGTSRFCSTCGAAIAQAIALDYHTSAERLCALEIPHDGSTSNLFLRIRATPLRLEGFDLILVFIDDVTRQQTSALAERAFFHDLNNTLTCLLNASETLAERASADLAPSASNVHKLTLRVVRELQLQRELMLADDIAQLTAAPAPTSPGEILGDLQRMLRHHPSSTGRRVDISSEEPGITFVADSTLLLRVLANMAINALEATHTGGEIRIRAQVTPKGLEFSVWNETPIPPEIARRIFQRNFSTKGVLGRGLGTHSMKLVGERLLGGRVSFDSSAIDGTTFRFLVPLQPPTPTVPSGD